MKIGLAESNQVKLIRKKKNIKGLEHIKKSPSLFWVLKGRQKGKESEEECVAETACFLTDCVCKLLLVPNKVD